MNIGIVLQARIGSHRFPGKTLRLLSGRPMIDGIMQRLEGAKRPTCRVLATTTSDGDDDVAAAARDGWTVFRGDEEDVLERYWQCAEALELDHIVRATGDNPLVDAAEADRLVEFHLDRGNDYSTSRTVDGSGLPDGVGVEVFTRDALARSHDEGLEPHHREHVNEYVLDYPEEFRIGVLAGPPELTAPELTLTVDHPTELAWMEALCDTFGPIRDISVTDIVAASRRGNLPEAPKRPNPVSA